MLAALLLWQFAAMLLGNQLLLVTPFVVLKKLAILLIDREFWDVLAFSFLRIVVGFLLALCTAIFLAALAGRFPWAEVMLSPYIAIIKSTPVASFIILCLIWLDARSLSVFIAFLIVLPVVYTNVLSGIKATDYQLLEMADLFEIAWWRRLRYIYIPQINPYLLSACSVAIGMSWKAGIAAEVIGIPKGSIGEKLYEAKVYFSTGDLFAWTLVIILVSILFEKLFMYGLRALLKERG